MYDITLLDFGSGGSVFGGCVKSDIESFVFDCLWRGYNDIDFIINNYQFNLCSMPYKTYCAAIRNDSTEGVVTKPDDMLTIETILRCMQTRSNDNGL